MKTILLYLLLASSVAAAIVCFQDNEVVYVTDDDHVPADMAGLPRLELDGESNADVIAQIRLTPREFSLVGTNLMHRGTPVSLMPSRAGSRRAMFALVRTRCASALGVMVASPADLRAKLPDIIAGCIATNNLGTAQAVAKANSVLIPLVQWQLLGGGR